MGDLLGRGRHGGRKSSDCPSYRPGEYGRLITEIALATNRLPSEWAAEEDEYLATVLDIYEKRNRDARKANRKRRR